ncbi:MAG: AMP-binding protein [Chloroflexi bacterium]|nr:AMP-binding protein [Chloroflexota bacterium]
MAESVLPPAGSAPERTGERRTPGRAEDVLSEARLAAWLTEPLLRRFERQVATAPERIALKSEALTLTYGELNRMVNRLAHLLRVRLGAGNQPVPFLVERGVWQVVATLGVLKAGKISVCVEPSNARERLKFILDDTQAGLLVSNRSNEVLAREVAGSDRQMVVLDELPTGLPDENLVLDVPPDDPAILFYTSGSTGTPKAVIHSHKTLLRNVFVRVFHDGIRAEDRQAIPFSFSFTWPNAHTFGSLLVGATVYPGNFTHLTGAEVSAFLAREGVTILHITPSLLRQFMQTLPPTYDGRFPNLRLVHTSGERLFPADVESWRSHFGPLCRLAYSYGASEASGIAANQIDKDTLIEGEFVPVGRPQVGYDISIVDAAGRPPPAGSVGQIVVASPYVALGYWRRPELTRAAFLQDPADPTVRIYATGDLGRWLPDGKLELLGRRDSQVKVRGYRVQLDEVEAALFGSGLAKEAAVVAKDDAQGEQCLAAYVVPSTQPRPTVSRLREALAASLPDYMLPSAYVFLDSLPLNANGKTDRPHLPEPSWARPPLDSLYVTPRDETELKLARIWEEALGLYGLGVHDDFFALGGHSLLAARCLARVEEVFGRQLPLAALYERPSIAGLAASLHEQPGEHRFSCLVNLKATGALPPLFWCHGYAGGLFNYQDLLRHIGKEQPVFGLVAPGLDGREPLLPTVESLAAHYVREITVLQPQGPYYLAGPSAGGIFALEIGRQLLAAGHAVDLLALLDSRPPWRRRRLHRPAEGRSLLGGFVQLGRHGLPIYWRTAAQPWLEQYAEEMLLPWCHWLAHETRRRLGLTRRAAYRDRLPALLEEVTRSALLRYHLRPYPGAATLFVAKGEHGLTPEATAIWRDLIRGGLEVAKVPGSHHTMFYEPNIQGLARLLRARLAPVGAIPTAG